MPNIGREGVLSRRIHQAVERGNIKIAVNFLLMLKFSSFVDLIEGIKKSAGEERVVAFQVERVQIATDGRARGLLTRRMLRSEIL